MKERPILFSAPMVRAILDGRKTQTRRLVTPATSEWGTGVRGAAQWQRFDFSDAFVDPGGTWLFGPGPYLKVKRPDDDTRHRLYPRIEPKMRLWVKETFGYLKGNGIRTAYRADGECPEELGTGRRIGGMKWRPSIFMRRHESRITLEVTGVRVERVQEITEEDAQQEGVLSYGEHLVAKHEGPVDWARPRFRELWDSINGDRASWASNPWVWAVEFRRVEGERAR